MATVKLLGDAELSPEAAAVFADIRAVRKSDFINNFWRALAQDPVTLNAVSVAHGCGYCIHSHTSAARAKGMSEAEYRELVAIVGMASETNRIVTALGVPVDREFEVS
jgi:AhpD family alkylhydroperoxidase